MQLAPTRRRSLRATQTPAKESSAKAPKEPPPPPPPEDAGPAPPDDEELDELDELLDDDELEEPEELLEDDEPEDELEDDELLELEGNGFITLTTTSLLVTTPLPLNTITP